MQTCVYLAGNILAILTKSGGTKIHLKISVGSWTPLAPGSDASVCMHIRAACMHADDIFKLTTNHAYIYIVVYN